MFTLFVGLLSFHQAQAQDWQKEIKNDSNFFSVQKAYYDEPDHALGKNEEQDGPDELYKRWEHFMAPRVNAQGDPLAPNIVYKELTKYNALHLQNKKSYKNGDWAYLGPVNAPAKAGGSGRINCLRFQPGHPQTMWAGTPSGGLWKTTDMGNTWTTNTDNIPNLGVTDLAINPRNADTMFMATGDGYGYGVNNGTFFGGSYSNGLMRSIDGGQTWDTTSLNWDRTKARQLFRVIVYPENPNIVIAIANNGIWRSKNGGNTWKNVLTDKCTDIKMNGGIHSTIYCGGSSFYVSKDTGASWTRVIIKFPINVGAMTIGVTPSNDSTIYIMLLTGATSSTNTTLMRSIDWGTSWKTMSTLNMTKFYGYYTSQLAVNPYKANEVVVGGLNMFRSSDSGVSWNQLSYDFAFPNSYYAHADHRVFEYFPGSRDTVFDGNDGGLYMSVDGGISWQLVSNGIHALELYRIGSSSNDSSLLYTGAQDNGVNQLYSGNWTKVIGGDGMTCQVSRDDPSIAYGSWQNGNLQKTFDYGSSWTTLYPPSAGTVNWTTPFVLDPFNSDVIYYGGTRLYQSPDGGSTWNNISSSLKVSGNISNIAVAPGDDKTIYISLGSEQNAPITRLYRSNDGGTTWISIVKGINLASGYLTGIAVDRRDPKHIAVSFAGYNTNQKIFISKDGGSTYTNLSSGLPNLPVNCVAFESSTEDGLFIGTDVGVFYRNDKTTGWITYNNGLPNVIINQIEIFPAIYKIRVATYGRGIWDGSLNGHISGVEKMAEIKSNIKVYPNPSTTGVFYLDLPESPYRNPEITVFDIMGQKTGTQKKIAYNGAESSFIDLSSLQNGIYLLNFKYSDGIISKKVQIMK